MRAANSDNHYLYLICSRRERFASELRTLLRRWEINVKDRYSCEDLDPEQWRENIDAAMDNAKLILIFEAVSTLDDLSDSYGAQSDSYRNRYRLAAQREREWLERNRPKDIYLIRTRHEGDWARLNSTDFFKKLSSENFKCVKFADDTFCRDPFYSCASASSGARAIYFSGQHFLLNRDFGEAFFWGSTACNYEDENSVFLSLLCIANENKSSKCEAGKTFLPENYKPFFDSNAHTLTHDRLVCFCDAHNAFFQQYWDQKDKCWYPSPRYELAAFLADKILDGKSYKAWIEDTTARVPALKQDVAYRMYNYLTALRNVSVANLIGLWNDFPKKNSDGEPSAGAELTLKLYEDHHGPCYWSFRYVPSSKISFDVDDRDNMRHTVDPGEGFWLAETPTTVRQWNVIVEKTTSGERHGQFWRHDPANSPVVDVSYNECRQFLKKMGRVGINFFIPSANDWIRACLAQKHELVDPVTFDGIVWHRGNWHKRELPDVGRLKPTEWGFHDLVGTVWEYTSTPCYLDGRKMSRSVTAVGGSCRTSDCSPFSKRTICDLDIGLEDVGFRVAFRHSELKRALSLDMFKQPPIE